MNKIILEKFKNINSISNFKDRINNQKVIYTSSLPHSAKSLLIKTTFQNEKQTVILLPKRIIVDEFRVELSELGFEKELVVISEFNQESIQEKITSLSKKEKFILLSTYKLLK